MTWRTAATRMWLTRSVHPFRFASEFDRTLPHDDASNLGLYIHIPFCRSICSFCPYCKRLYDQALAQDYIAALKQEIALVTDGHPRRTVTSLYFGGGTPALVADDIAGIVDVVKGHFDITDGIGLELHPRDVTVETLQTLRAAGVTRISIGVQSFSDDYLSVLGRSKQDWQPMFQALAAVPFETVSMDLIFALPGQTIESMRRDIDTAFENGANHIAIYPFIDFTYTSRTFAPMSEPDKRLLLDRITDHCESKGLVRDSIWTFAEPGTPKYSSMTRENFLGFGASATSLLTDSFKVNTFSVPDYIARVTGEPYPGCTPSAVEAHGACLPTSLTIRFTRRQRMVYWLFWTAYTMHVDARDFEAFFGEPLEHAYGLELKALQRLGFLEKDGPRYTMTRKGAYWYHYYEHFYTLSYIDQMWSLMAREPFPSELVIR